MGVIVFGLIFNLLTQLDLATEWQQIVKGVIILVAVLDPAPRADLTPCHRPGAARLVPRPHTTPDPCEAGVNTHRQKGHLT